MDNKSIIKKNKYFTTVADYVYWKNARFIAEIIQKESHLKKNYSILDIGCHKCFLKDILPKSINYVGINIDKTKDCVIEFDLNQGFLPIESGYFNIIVCTDVLEHLFYPEKIILEINRCLKSEGIFIISLPNDLGLTALFSYVSKWLLRNIEPIQTQIYSHHWKFSRRTAIDFLKNADLSSFKYFPYTGPYLIALKPIIKIFPSLCTTFFFVGGKS
jgi:2-polyprenyl-3-methyl-5-hydroxy-6-metoxy-1,4-benzoquinol methylase